MAATSNLLMLQAYSGKRVAESHNDLPALELLIEIELKDGSQASLQRALAHRQGCCRRGQAQLNEIMERIDPGPVVWNRPGTYIPRWITRVFGGKFLLELIEVGLFEVSLPQSSKGTLLLKI